MSSASKDDPTIIPDDTPTGVLELPAEAVAKLIELVVTPPPPSPRLKAAAKRHTDALRPGPGRPGR